MTKNRIIIIGLILFICQHFQTVTAQNNFIFKNNKSDYFIVISSSPSSVDSLAASELQYFLSRYGNVTIPIVTDSYKHGRKFISLGENKLSSNIYRRYSDSINYDGFLIHSENKNIYIVGNEGKSVLYGTYHFIENYLGFRMLTPDYIYEPQPCLMYKLPKIHDIENPSFAYRETLYRFPNVSKRYADWHKLQNRSDMNRNWGLFVHTFRRLISPDKYYKDHPEWFSEISGRRVSDGQLCLSNPEVLEELCKNLKKEMDKRPDAKIWSVSQNDNEMRCQCENCRALDSIYGSSTGTLIHFINQVAERFPDKTISTLAYQYSRHAPTKITPLSNVNIMLCSIECERHKPLANNPSEHGFVQDLIDWHNLTDNIFLWDYVVQFRNFMDPFPNLHVLKPNLQLFHDEGTVMMFEQGSNNNMTEMMELRTYMLAKLMWNVNADDQQIIDDFVSHYYGPCALYVRQYIDKMKLALINSDNPLKIYGFPYDGREGYLSPGMICYYQSLFNKAYSMIDSTSVYYDRIRFLELSLDFAILDLSLNNISDELSYFSNINGVRTLRKDMMDKAQRFVFDCNRFGVKMLEEMDCTPEKYLDIINNFMDKNLQLDIARGKKVTVSTKWSDTYDVGGPKALTDGVFGVMDYNHNWLGFEGQNLDAVVDLDAIQTVHEISMDFYYCPLSWIYIPKKVEYYTSVDSVNWFKAGEIQYTNENGFGKTQIHNMKIDNINTNARYIRVYAQSILTNPIWHRGYGQPCWIFTDEIRVH